MMWANYVILSVSLFYVLGLTGLMFGTPRGRELAKDALYDLLDLIGRRVCPTPTGKRHTNK